MQTRKNANLAPESFRHSAVPRRLKHRARRRRRILCLLPVILVFGVLAAALLRFTPALAYADIFPAQASTRRIKDVPYISQLPTLPTGCESAGAAMLLNYYGAAPSQRRNLLPITCRRATRRTRTKTESLSAATHGRHSPATRFRKPAGDATPPSLSAP